MTPAHLIPARIQIFSPRAVREVTGFSRTSQWRHRKSKGGKFPDPVKLHERRSGNMGVDIVDFIQEIRADAGLPPAEEADILAALIAAEETIAALERSRNTRS